MVKEKLSRFLIYRWRYIFAYTAFCVALATLLLIAGFYLPGGLSATEIRSALISNSLDPALIFSLNPEQLLYLPYRLLQAGSIALFGFTAFSIKLPSLLLGFTSALGILYLLNIWYRRNVAIITAMIAVTTNQFLLSSQAGQSGVMYIFLTTMILVAASMIARRGAFGYIWVLVGFVLAGISLYMPLNIYMLLAIGATAFVHPHARHLLLRESSKAVLLGGSVLFVIIISPLIIGIMNDPTLLRTLLGIPESFSTIQSEFVELARQYGQVYAPTTGAVVVPIYGLGILLLLLVGMYRLVSAKYTTKSYIVSLWLLLLVPLVCLNPGFISITFVPVVLLIALGIDYLISSWYRLFPFNPYARVFGLLPLGVLVAGLIVSSVDRYAYGFRYDESVPSSYNFDLRTLTRTLRAMEATDKVRLVVTKDQEQLYRVFAEHQQYVESVTVTTKVPRMIPSDEVLIVERTLKHSVPTIPDSVIVSNIRNDSDRFYLYKTLVK